MRTLVASGLIAGLLVGAASVTATPVAAQDNLTGRVLTEVCLPYANRAQSFEKSIRAARELKFRRPASERDTPLEEFASEINLVSRDGSWRVRLEEGTVDVGDDGSQAYSVSCSLSSTRVGAGELAALGRRAFRNERVWTSDEGNAPREWDRRTGNPDERRMEVRIVEEEGSRPTLVIRGLYF